jgi:DNA (cytosine-5)-methyltransferase 1
VGEFAGCPCRVPGYRGGEVNGQLTVGSLFAGIGGFDLGFERAGMRTAWFCEQDDYCRRVLNRHWSDVPVYPDVTQLRGSEVERVDVLAGGFPCQDLSLAGKGAGITGSRSGLWSEYARLIGELRPRYVVVENVTALLGRGFGTVLGDLAALGYDTEWDCIPASAVGAPHRRDRVWLVAYPTGKQEREQANEADAVATTGGAWHEPVNCGSDVADTAGKRFKGPRELEYAGNSATKGEGQTVEFVNGGVERAWSPEPALGRVVDGFPGRMDQLAALGNALVPQIAEWIGERIVSWEQS